MKWQSISSEELILENSVEGKLTSLLPDTAGIYMWKINLNIEKISLGTSSLMDHLKFITTSKFAISEPSKVFHSLQIGSVILQGAGLTEDKLELFNALAQSQGGQKYIRDFLNELNTHLPSLYVGETGNIAKRAKEHLEDSTFTNRLEINSDLNLSDLNFYYLEIPQAEKPIRQAFESLTTMLTGGWLVKRQG